MMNGRDFHDERPRFSWFTVKVKQLVDNFSMEVSITEHFKIEEIGVKEP